MSGKEDTESKNYIVMSTTAYDSNTPEADKNGLTKVTFTKIVTEDVTTETTGTKYVVATEGKLSFSATEGFTYTVALPAGITAYYGKQKLTQGKNTFYIKREN